MDSLPRNKERHDHSHFDLSSIMNSLPLHLIDEILFKLEHKSLAMMRCTSKSIRSYLTNPIFGPAYPLWVRPSLYHLSSYGAYYISCMPLDSICDSWSQGKEASLLGEICYIFGSCSGLLLLYIGYLFVANPLTKRFRIIDHSGSKLIPWIVGGNNIWGTSDDCPDSNVVHTERAMCVGFAVNHNRTTKRFKIVCIIEMETMYGFEINDGDLWRLSETTITASTKSDLTTRIKPVYLDNTLHWLRNDGSIIAFNPESEQARFIPSIFHREPDTKLLFAKDDKSNTLTLITGTKETITVYTLLGNHKWALARQIENVYVSMGDKELRCWNMAGYDGKCLMVRVARIGIDSIESFVHGYNMEANSWRVLGATPPDYSCVLDFYKFTPSMFFVEEYEQQKVIAASNDRRIFYLNAIMGLIKTTK